MFNGLCSFFQCLHQSIRWLIYLHPVPEPLGLPEEGSWQHCMQSLWAGRLPAFPPGKTCSWSSLHLAPLAPRRVITLRSGDFATDQRPASDLNTTSVIPHQYTGVAKMLLNLPSRFMRFCQPHHSKPFILSSQQTSPQMDLYKVQRSPASFLP